MDGKPLPFQQNDPRPLQDLCLAIRTKGMRPVSIVEYERTAFVYPVGNVRVTFDRNIAGSKYTGLFLNPSLPLVPILNQGQHILEVKHDELLPSYITAALDTGCLEQTAFSKYCMCRLKLKNM